jgi:hypothetical protein
MIRTSRHSVTLSAAKGHERYVTLSGAKGLVGEVRVVAVVAVEP